VEGGLPKNWTEVNSSKTREAKALQERFGCRKAQAAIATGEFLHKLEIPHFHDEPALVGIEKPVDFRLADWLLKGDAGEHFEREGRETKITARSALFVQICGQRRVVDLGSEEQNSIEDSQLEAYEAKLTVGGNERGD
jgi:hypothetical protein